MSAPAPRNEEPVVLVETPEEDKPKRRWFKRKEKRPPRPLLLRLFGISPWGALKLAGLCVFVGFFVIAAQFDPREPNVDVSGAVASMTKSLIQATGWAVRNFWKPALAGAGVVLPIWVLWRLISLPFRR